MLRFSRAVVCVRLLGGPRRYAAPLQRLSRVRYHPPPPSSESETHFRRYFRPRPSVEVSRFYDTIEHFLCSRRRSRCAFTPGAVAPCSNTYSPPLRRPLRRSRDVWVVLTTSLYEKTFCTPSSKSKVRGRRSGAERFQQPQGGVRQASPARQAPRVDRCPPLMCRSLRL